MNSEKNHWLALYLSGQYPGNYRLPNRFDVVLKIRQLDLVNFSDSMLSILKDKWDAEFYNSLFNAFESLHWEKWYLKLLKNLNIPENILIDPFIEKEVKREKIKYKKSIWFLTPFDTNKEIKEDMVNKIIPKDWIFESFDLKPFNDDWFLWNQIKNFLEKHSFYIVDLRPKKNWDKKYNENVLLELGYILAKEKPLILIKRDWLSIPSDLQWIPYVLEKMIPESENDNSNKDSIKEKLKIEIEKMIIEFK